MGTALRRLLAIADEPGDDDDLRLRKRVGVAAGYIITIGALQLPAMSQGLALGWAVALTMSPIGAVNLALLARTKRFERYVVVLVLMVTLFPAFINLALGGMAASAGSYVFAFVGPMFAVLALGPRRAIGWLILYLLLLVGLIVVDPLISAAIPARPYELRLVFFLSNFSVPLVIVFFLLRYTEQRRLEAQARVDELLTNAIPVSIARRLKAGERRIAEVYPETTVLFADLVGFTPWTRRTDPREVVSFLDELFSRFDGLAAEHGVEKVKTIGDSYMAVAGAPEPVASHAAAALAVGRGMLGAMAEARVGVEAPLEVRIGLASGPVVGGVIGQRRILFDLWGDTVNTASRMESSGVPGRIQVAPSTRDLLAGEWTFDEREPVDVKGLGQMTRYLLVDRA